VTDDVECQLWSKLCGHGQTLKAWSITAIVVCNTCRFVIPNRWPRPASQVGSIGDSYDNALAESVIGLFKTEFIRREGPWRGIDQVEFETLDWVCWYNQRRLLEPIGYVPPAEFEDTYYRNQTALATTAGVN
jgi:hypothetical protein